MNNDTSEYHSKGGDNLLQDDCNESTGEQIMGGDDPSQGDGNKSTGEQSMGGEDLQRGEVDNNDGVDDQPYSDGEKSDDHTSKTKEPEVGMGEEFDLANLSPSKGFFLHIHYSNIFS